MTQYNFGTGQLYATPVGGGAPLRFGALQDVSIDISGDIKELYGQYQFALDTARGKTKVEWKASTGNIDVTAFNTLFFGQSVADGDELIQAFNESAAVPGSSPYTVTVDESATFFQDLGVYDAVTGLPLKQVASGPASGEYSVSVGGVYTFHSSSSGDSMLFNYMYESPSTGGSLEVTNQLMGNTPKFQLILSQLYKGKTFTAILYSCTSDKLSLPMKQDDYTISEMSGMANANDAGKIMRISTTSVGGGGA